MTTSLRGARPIGRASSDLFRGARELERKGFNGQALAEQAALTKLKEPKIYRDGERDAERSATERMQTGLLAERRDASLEARGVTVEATGSKLAARQGLFKEAQDAGSFTPEMKTRGAALGISESGFAQAQSRMKPPVSQPNLGTAGSPPPAATSGESPVVKKPLAERDATSSVPILGGVLNTPVDPVSKINGVAGSSVLAGMNSDANRREGGDRARNNIATMGQAGAVADYFKRKDQPAEPGNLAELKARDAADSPSPASTVKGPLQTAMEEAMASRERRAANTAEARGITAGINSAPAPKLDTSFPTPTAPVDAPTPAVPAAPETPRSFAYNLGRGIRNAPNDVSVAIGDTGLAAGRAVKRGAANTVAAAEGAANAVGEAVSDAGLAAGRKVKRNSRDFRSGLSGR